VTPRTPLIIGFAGRAGAGKDSAAQALYYAFGCDVAVFAFAEPLRSMIDALLDYANIIAVDGMSRAEKEAHIDLLGASPRRLLQTLGTDWGRHMIKPTLWVDILRQRVADRAANFRMMLVTDVRFDDEAELIHQLGEVWLIERDVPGVEAHISEAGISPALITRRVRNDGTLNDLQDRLIGQLSLHRAWPREGAAA
jgi:hypothetical protein